ncbi:hypothetical protein SAMN05519104_4396 [Rhizobiales bacterium GAS188]|nr:hypothetical protein SAMN05519104_4396 [Rhizobiales bacterium GAS188]
MIDSHNSTVFESAPQVIPETQKRPGHNAEPPPLQPFSVSADDGNNSSDGELKEQARRLLYAAPILARKLWQFYLRLHRVEGHPNGNLWRSQQHHAEHFNVDQPAVSRYCLWLRKAGILQITERYKAKVKCDRYRLTDLALALPLGEVSLAAQEPFDLIPSRPFSRVPAEKAVGPIRYPTRLMTKILADHERRIAKALSKATRYERLRDCWCILGSLKAAGMPLDEADAIVRLDAACAGSSKHMARIRRSAFRQGLSRPSDLSLLVGKQVQPRTDGLHTKAYAYGSRESPMTYASAGDISISMHQGPGRGGGGRMKPEIRATKQELAAIRQEVQEKSTHPSMRSHLQERPNGNEFDRVMRAMAERNVVAHREGRLGDIITHEVRCIGPVQPDGTARFEMVLSDRVQWKEERRTH